MSKTITDLTPVSPGTYSAIKRIISTADYTRKCYFWNPSPTASQRRGMEEKYTCPKITWTENGHTFTAEFSYRESCKNVYAKGYYTKDGISTNLKAIKYSFDRLIPLATVSDSDEILTPVLS